MKQVKRKDLMQFVRYLLVGVINTLVTLIIIYMQGYNRYKSLGL